MTRERRRQALTNSMQALGLLHIEQNQTDIPEETEKLIHEHSLINRMIHFLENESSEDPKQTNEEKRLDAKEVIKNLQKIDEKLDTANQKIEKLEKQADQLVPWGNYDYHQKRKRWQMKAK